MSGKDERQHERPVRRRGQVGAGRVAGHGDLLAGGDLHHAAVLVLAVLAVPEVVELGDDRVVVEVVLGGGRRDAPLEAAGVPRVGARAGAARRRPRFERTMLTKNTTKLTRDEERARWWTPCSRS